jgi:hypothetical protein
MSLNERHKWCAKKILEAFPDLENEQIQDFIRKDHVLQKFNLFFKGESSGRLFVLYQPAVSDKEVINFLLNHIFTCILRKVLFYRPGAKALDPMS